MKWYQKIDWIKAAMAAAILLFWIILFGITSCASGPGYDRIEQTQDQEVTTLTEQIGSQYGICPELLQAVIFYESSNRSYITSAAGDTGYMQVNPQWHYGRMERLGVSDLCDGYSNILAGTDYLSELAGKYEDVGLVLMKYNGDSRADSFYEAGKLSEYAQRILNLSAELERAHGK